jgi:hypothetical protein
LRRRDIEVGGLLTTLNQAAGRVAMHGVRRSLLEAQAESVGLPLWQIPLPRPCTNEDYEARMAKPAAAQWMRASARLLSATFSWATSAYRERQLPAPD